MKKVLKVLVILIVVALLAVDFYGLWKYKLNGKQYVLENGDSDDSGLDDSADYEDETYEELTGETLTDGKTLFIRNIEKKEDEYEIRGIILEPYEVSKDDYTALRSGDSVEILGATYKKNKIKNNNLYVKATDGEATAYYISYDTSIQKYVLKETDSDNVVYKPTDKKVKFSVEEGITFAIVKDGKTSKKKIEDVVETHTDLKVPESVSANITTSALIFSAGKCIKITETVR